MNILLSVLTAGMVVLFGFFLSYLWAWFYSEERKPGKLRLLQKFEQDKGPPIHLFLYRTDFHTFEVCGDGKNWCFFPSYRSCPKSLEREINQLLKEQK